MGLFDLFKKKKTATDSGETHPEEYIVAHEAEKPPTEEYSIRNEPPDEERETNIEQVQVEEEIPDIDFDPLDSLGPYDPKLDLANYEFPAFSLLNKKEFINTEETISPSRIAEILNSFGVKANSITANIGAVITLFEIVPEPGVKIATIRRLEEDIAIYLSIPKISIVPIPKRGAIGIVVPNKYSQILSLVSILNSTEFSKSQDELPIALGMTMTNDIFTFDLCKMPHILVAGATGQGKSVGLNVMITSLLYKKHPAELKLVLIDPRIVEFNLYTPIRNHFLTELPNTAPKAIVSDIRSAIATLNSLVKEMNDRYNLLAESNTRDIKEYNEKFVNRKLNPLKGHRHIPYIVVVIDEFADLLIPDDKILISVLDQLTSKAHTVGIHLIISTQRPTAKIITSSIKANFPARLAFKVSSSMDSRTILDEPGAELLTGRGDALFSLRGKISRIQAAYIGTNEIENVASFIGNQQGYPFPYSLSEDMGGHDCSASGAVDLSDLDALFDEAARLIVIHQQGSTSLIQRKFSIGYNRAGRLMEQLEAARIVGAFEGSKARQVLVSDEYQLEMILANIR